MEELKANIMSLDLVKPIGKGKGIYTASNGHDERTWNQRWV